MSLEQPANLSIEVAKLNSFAEDIKRFFGDVNEAYCAIGKNPKDSFDTPPSQEEAIKKHFDEFDTYTKRQAFIILFEKWSGFLVSDEALKLQDDLDHSGQIKRLTKLIEQTNVELHAVEEAKGPEAQQKAA